MSTAALGDGSPGGKKRSLLTELREDKILYLMILPTVAGMVIFRYLPMFGIVMAFQNFSPVKGFLGSPWASSHGFGHFIDFFTRTLNVGRLFGNTLGIAVIKLLVGCMPPVALAIVFNEFRSLRYKRIAQTISYLPHFISWPVIGGLLYLFFLNSPSAPVNALLIRMNLIERPYDFLNNQWSLWSILVFSDIWKGVGWGSIIYLALITGVDPQLYEAIDIDGGGRWVKIRHVTWPALVPTFVIFFILSIGGIMRGGGSTFDQLYILGSMINRPFGDIIGFFVYRVGLQEARFSFGAAVGLFQSVTNMILLLVANAVSKKLRGSGLF